MPIVFNFFYFFTHHLLSRQHHTWTNKYINLPHTLVRDESAKNDALKNQKINCDELFAPILKFDGHFCSKFFFTWVYLHLRGNYMEIFSL